jgi:hypothetical protein
MPSLRIAPATTKIVGEVGDLGSFTLEVASVRDLGAFEAILVFDPSVIQIEAATIGAFAASTGRTTNALPLRIDNENGTLTVGAWTTGAGPGPEGSGILAEVTVRMHSCPGSSPVEIEGAVVTDTRGWPGLLGEASPGFVSTECRAPTSSPAPELPAKLTLLPSRPNPFGASTSIPILVPASTVEAPAFELRILDATGRIVRRLRLGTAAPGRHELVWDGRDDSGREVPSGTYFCRASWGEAVLSRRIQLIR